MVVIDRFSKAAHFEAYLQIFLHAKPLNCLPTSSVKLHGYLRSIISNRNPIFLSKFWRTSFQLEGTKLRMSTGYHPQINSQTEVLNR